MLGHLEQPCEPSEESDCEDDGAAAAAPCNYGAAADARQAPGAALQQGAPAMQLLARMLLNREVGPNVANVLQRGLNHGQQEAMFAAAVRVERALSLIRLLPEGQANEVSTIQRRIMQLPPATRRPYMRQFNILLGERAGRWACGLRAPRRPPPPPATAFRRGRCLDRAPIPAPQRRHHACTHAGRNHWLWQPALLLAHPRCPAAPCACRLQRTHSCGALTAWTCAN